MTPLMRRNLVLTPVIIVIAVFAFRIPVGEHARVSPHQQAMVADALLHATQPEQSEPHAVEPPRIEAASALVIDPKNMRVLFEKNTDMPHAIASVSKIMTALVALERAGEDDMVTVSADAVATEGSAGGLVGGERIRLRDLIAMMMVESSNDAAVAIAEHIGRIYGATAFNDGQNLFTALMNTHAADLGMRNTLFRNPTGLDIDETTASNISTAHDLALLLQYSMSHATIWMPSEATELTVVSFDGYEHALRAINSFALTGHSVLGSKTGFTDLAGGVLVALVEAPIGSPKIAVILKSSREGRFSDMNLLVAWARE